MNLLFLLLLLAPLWWQLKRDFIKGLVYAVFLCVSASGWLRISLPGALPELTIFRLVIIILFIFWLKERRLGRLGSAMPYFGLFSFYALACLLSVVLTDAGFANSYKRFLDFILEFWGFYLIVTTAVQSRMDAVRILRGAAIGLGVVAFLAFVERYTGFNPEHLIAPPGEAAGFLRDVTVTYRHRILLGTGLAMGLPLALVLIRLAPARKGRVFYGCLTLLMAGGCYFANSRGPWLGFALACAALLWLGTDRIRKGLVFIVALVFLVLIVRPGVYATLLNRAEATSDADSFKGGTFRYRLELWKVAWTEIVRSPLRLLFGYGLGAGLEKQIEWDLSFRARTETISSWDNHFAYDLLQCGVLGLGSKLLLLCAIVVRILRDHRHTKDEDREVLAAAFASILVLLFMMSNVLIFAKQLNFLFATVAAVAFAFGEAARCALAADVPQDPGLAETSQLEPTFVRSVAGRAV